jgi:hypothetical protein
MKSTALISFFICFLILTLTVGLGMGCSESGGKATASNNRISSACDLVSKEKVSEIFGTTFGKAEETQHRESDNIMMSMCTFSDSADSGMTTVSVMIVYDSAIIDPNKETEDFIKSVREELKDPNYQFETVQDVGGAALYDPSAKQLTVFDEGRKFIFMAFGKGPKQKMIDLARVIFSE